MSIYIGIYIETKRIIQRESTVNDAAELHFFAVSLIY